MLRATLNHSQLTLRLLQRFEHFLAANHMAIIQRQDNEQAGNIMILIDAMLYGQQERAIELVTDFFVGEIIGLQVVTQVSELPNELLRGNGVRAGAKLNNQLSANREYFKQLNNNLDAQLSLTRRQLNTLEDLQKDLEEQGERLERNLQPHENVPD